MSAEWGRREGRGGARQSQADGRPAGLCSPTRPRAASGRGSHARGLLGEEQASFPQREGKRQGLLVTAAVFFHVAVLTNSPVPRTVFAEGERTCLRSLQHVKARDDLPTGVTHPLRHAHRRHHVGCRALSLCLKCSGQDYVKGREPAAMSPTPCDRKAAACILIHSLCRFKRSRVLSDGFKTFSSTLTRVKAVV